MFVRSYHCANGPGSSGNSWDVEHRRGLLDYFSGGHVEPGAAVGGVRGGAGRGGRVLRGDGGRPDGGAEHAGAGRDVRRQRHEEPPGGLLRRGAVSVQHSLTDRVPGHGPHWEAG